MVTETNISQVLLLLLLLVPIDLQAVINRQELLELELELVHFYQLWPFIAGWASQLTRYLLIKLCCVDQIKRRTWILSISLMGRWNSELNSSIGTQHFSSELACLIDIFYPYCHHQLSLPTYQISLKTIFHLNYQINLECLKFQVYQCLYAMFPCENDKRWLVLSVHYIFYIIDRALGENSPGARQHTGDLCLTR